MHTLRQQQLADNLAQVRQQIAQHCETYRCNQDVELMAVSKFHAADDIAYLVSLGQTQFGENYVQELLQKQQQLAQLAIEWHFIGPLQSNKCKEIAAVASWIHSIDRAKLIPLLAKHRPTTMPPLKLCIQVNIDNEASKSGVRSFEELVALADLIRQYPNLSLQGLMVIPEMHQQLSEQRRAFAQLSDWQQDLSQHLGIPLTTKSMGMSADLEAAIAEGATIVRIGTAIFGERPVK